MQDEELTPDPLDAVDVYPPDVDDLLADDGNEVPIPRAAKVRQSALQNQQQRQQMQQQNARSQRIAKKTQRKLLTQENRRKAIELRKAGSTYEQIANALGYADASGARKAVMKAMEGVTQEPSQELKVLQMERYNHMLLTVWGRVQQGDDRALSSALAVMDRINDLGGVSRGGGSVTVNIDQSTHENAVLVVEGNKEDYIAAMKRMVGVREDGTNIPREIEAVPSTVVDKAVDEVDAEVVVDGDDKPLSETLTQEDIDVVHAIMAPPKKTFQFGVDPTVKREDRT